ncbi:MAG: CPBP family intramembrane metalloprotease [Myxococcaceae bacterium]|nr:CPBP family intramembrane metalloprotease [Myxococcaceae bacterium]
MSTGGHPAPARPSAAARFARAVGVYLRELGGEPTVVICGACAVLILSHYQGSTSFFRSVFGAKTQTHPWSGALPYFWWFGWSLLLYLAVPLLLSRVTRGSFTRRYGLGLGDWRAGLWISGLFLLVMVPAVYLASRTPSFAHHYPLAGNGAFTIKGPDGKPVVFLEVFFLYELAYFLYFVGWEFLFRGWMLNGLLPRFGRGGAILCQVAPFALMHLGKPEPEALGSIVAGVALGILALRTRSFWYGAILHGCIAVWMDLLAAWPYIRGP